MAYTNICPFEEVKFICLISRLACLTVPLWTRRSILRCRLSKQTRCEIGTLFWVLPCQSDLDKIDIPLTTVEPSRSQLLTVLNDLLSSLDNINDFLISKCILHEIRLMRRIPLNPRSQLLTVLTDLFSSLDELLLHFNIHRIRNSFVVLYNDNRFWCVVF